MTIGGTASLNTGQLQLHGHQLAIGPTGSLAVGNSSGLSSPGSITNAGNFTYSGPDTLTISSAFNNQAGTLAIESGSVVLKGGGTSTGATFNIAAGATLDVTGSASGRTPSWTGTYTGSGAGQIQLSGGAITIGSGGATFNFPSGLFQWTAGDIDYSGGGVLTNIGVITAAPSSGATVRIVSGILDNKGTINQSGAGTFVLFGAGGGEVENEAGAVYDFQSDGTPFVEGPGGGTIVNAGTIEKTGGTGTTTVSNVALNNSGTLDVESGTLALLSPETSTGGTFSVATGAVLQLAPAGGFTTFWTGTYSGSGGGQVELSGGEIAVGSGGATFNFPAGLFQWSSGSIRNLGGGPLTNTGTITVAPSSGATVVIGGLLLNNQGTIDQSAPAASSSSTGPN